MSGIDLELSNGTGSTFVDLASSATNFIQDYIFGLKSEPITSSHDLKYPNADELHALAQPLEAKSTINERGSSMQDILSHLGQVMQTSVTKSSHSGHVAFINGGGILAGAIGAMLASALHVQTGLWAECPSMIALEESVLQWMASMLGYPSTSSQGIITSGGSTTLLTAMICARHRYLPVDQMDKGIMYITEQSNCSVHKSAKLLGLAKHQIRVISVNEDHRMNLEELVNTIEKDLAEGLKPFMIVGNAGTTDTGNIFT
jgi:glutamate/tyrosine decarboxylase-like PLP-dependent enzyme